MRRLFWLSMGATMGVLVVRKVSAAAERLTPSGVLGSVSDGLRDLASAVGEFGADVRVAAAEREAELRVAAGLDAPMPVRRPLALPAGQRLPLPRNGWYAAEE
jgi:chromosome condensin MukBEF MukE localization factor